MKPNEFWTWFQENQQKLYILPMLAREEKQNLYYTLIKNLDQYCKGLGFCIRFADNYHGTATLTITAYGVKELFPKVIELVEAAPKINNWNINAFIKQKENQNPDHLYKLGSLEINVKDLSFQPVKYIKSTGRIIIHIYFDKKSPSLRSAKGGESNPINPKALKTVIIFIIEDLLGEELLYAKIKNIKCYRNNRNRGITYKLRHLQEYLNLINQN